MIIISNRNQNRGSLAAILWGENDISSDANVLGHAALSVKTSYIGRVVSWSCVMLIHSFTPVRFAAQLVIYWCTLFQLMRRLKPLLSIANRNQNWGSLAVMIWGSSDISYCPNVLGREALSVKTSYIGSVVSWSCVIGLFILSPLYSSPPSCSLMDSLDPSWCSRSTHDHYRQ